MFLLNYSPVKIITGRFKRIKYSPGAMTNEKSLSGIFKANIFLFRPRNSKPTTTKFSANCR